MANNDWASALGGFLSSFSGSYNNAQELALKKQEAEMMKEYRKAQIEEIAMKRQMQEFELNNEREAALALKNFNGGGQPQQYGDPLKSNTQPTVSNLSRPLSNEYVLPDVAAQKGVQTQTQSYNGMTPNIQETPTIPGFVTGARTDKLIPEFNNRLQVMAQAYLAATGEPLQLTDSYRDYNGQVDVRNRKGNLAATPGTSMHGYGGAVDGSSEQFNKADKMGLLKLYGLDRPVNGESWHVQPSGLNSNELKASGRSGDNPGSAYNDYLPKMVGLDETVKRVESMPPVNVQNIVSNSPDVNSAAESLTKQKIVRAMAKMNAMAPHVGSKIGKRYYDMAKDEVEMLTKDTRTPQEKLDAEFNQHVRVDRYNKQSELAQIPLKAPLETAAAVQKAEALIAPSVKEQQMKQSAEIETWTDPTTRQSYRIRRGEPVPQGLVKDTNVNDAGNVTRPGGMSHNQMMDQHKLIMNKRDNAIMGKSILDNGTVIQLDPKGKQSIIDESNRQLAALERTMVNGGITSFPYVTIEKPSTTYNQNTGRGLPTNDQGSHAQVQPQQQAQPQQQQQQRTVPQLDDPTFREQYADHMASQYAGMYKTQQEIDALLNRQLGLTSDPNKKDIVARVRKKLYTMNGISTRIVPGEKGGM